MPALRRRSIGGVVLWLAGIGPAVAWGASAIADMEHADVTGGRGDIFHGVGWLVAAVAAVAAATASIVLAARPRGVRA
jgi:hypothetical protein